MVGGLFAFFRKDIDAIRPGELAKRVHSTVTTYLDRSGKVLWEDKGDSDYKLVVESDEISKYLKEATVAIEDHDFYSHSGISFSGLTRAFINNISGGYTQGGSTLTQQLVKQVFFADEAQDRGIRGIPRKIKEMILSIEVERMYNKDQILTLYLNESPYGGRRNGAESAAQTYFGKNAKDLTLAEAALLAAIPQNPSVYNPYNVAGHKSLLARQHTVLDNMVSMGKVTRKQAEEAKKYPIIDHLIPEASQYASIKAPHFVQMVRAELEKELGKATVGKGGLIVKTTLDLKIQNKLEEAVDTMFNSYIPASAGFSNGAATVEDTKTGQIVALVGSRDFNYPGYGQDNAATAYIQPGSTIKPLVYSELFEKKPTGSANYGSGSIMNDTNIDAIYGAQLLNADHQFKGHVKSEYVNALSYNIPPSPGPPLYNIFHLDNALSHFVVNIEE
jgi:penicillin-binding protein 1A